MNPYTVLGMQKALEILEDYECDIGEIRFLSPIFHGAILFGNDAT